MSDRRFLMLVILTLVLIGGGLIAIKLGLEALLTALPCLLGGAVLILVPWVLLTVAENLRDRLGQAERQALETNGDAP